MKRLQKIREKPVAFCFTTSDHGRRDATTGEVCKVPPQESNTWQVGLNSGPICFKKKSNKMLVSSCRYDEFMVFLTHRWQPQTVWRVKAAPPVSFVFVRWYEGGARKADPLKQNSKEKTFRKYDMWIKIFTLWYILLLFSQRDVYFTFNERKTNTFKWVLYRLNKKLTLNRLSCKKSSHFQLFLMLEK